MQIQLNLVLEAVASMQEYQNTIAVETEAKFRYLIVELLDEKLNLVQNARKYAETNNMLSTKSPDSALIDKLKFELEACRKEKAERMHRDIEEGSTEPGEGHSLIKRMEELQARNKMLLQDLEDTKFALSEVSNKYENECGKLFDLQVDSLSLSDSSLFLFPTPYCSLYYSYMIT